MILILDFGLEDQRKTKDTLTPERIERLDALGFVWDPSNIIGKKALVSFRTFKEREGIARFQKDTRR